MLAVLNGRANDRQIGFEVQFEYAQRLLDVSGRGSNGDQRQNHITLSNVVFNPFFIDGDITLEEVHARIADNISQAVCLHIHAIDFPVGRFQNALGKMVADKAVDAEDEDFFHSVVGSDRVV